MSNFATWFAPLLLGLPHHFMLLRILYIKSKGKNQDQGKFLNKELIFLVYKKLKNL